MAIFNRNDVNRDGVLSFGELERLILQLHAELGLRGLELPEDRTRLVRMRMRKFDRNGDGVLNANEFLELYSWTLWRKYEDLDPPRSKREDLIGGMKAGVPSQFYRIGKMLGTGQFGVVNEVVHRQTQMERALKTINKQRAKESGSPLALLNQEIDLLAMLDHPHVLRLFEHYSDTMNIYIVTDLCAGGELHDIVKEHADACRPLPEAWIRRVFVQLMGALAYCHSKGVMHKDLKFEHVMFQKKITCSSPIDEIHAILIDVGLAELFGPLHGKRSRSQTPAGSLCTMAPEVLMQDFSYKCDVWGAGCMLYAIFNVVPHYLPDGRGGKVLYTYPFAPQPTETDPMGINGLLEAQRAGPPMDAIHTASPAVREVIQRALRFDERGRPSAQQLLAMPWFTEDLGSAAIHLTREQVNALQFDRENRLWWRTMAVRAATQLPASRLGFLERRFQDIDTNVDGRIDHRELAAFLQDLGVPPSAADRAAQASDFDNNGQIEWSEFVASMLPASHELFAVSLQAAFQSLDINCDGMLDRGELLKLLQGGKIDDMHMPALKTAETMIAELDADRNGEVSFTEFHNYFVNADGST